MDSRKNIYIAIFVITTIIAACLAVYFKIDGDRKNMQVVDNTSNEKTDVNTSETKVEVREVEKIKKIGVTNFYMGSAAIVSDGNVFVNITNSVYTNSYIKTLFGDEISNLLTEVKGKYVEYNFDGLDYCDQLNNKFTGLKLNTSNVNKVYIFEYGQMLNKNYGLILLNNDNTISVISLYSLLKGKTDVKKIDDLSDIESIVYESQTPYAVKMNGEKVNLIDLVPNDYNEF